MMQRYLLLILISLFSIQTISAQSAKKLEKKADKELEDGNYMEAVVLLTQAIEKDPENPSLRIKRGNLHYVGMNLLYAELDYTKAIELDEDNLDAYMLRGEVYTMKFEPYKAIDDFNKAYTLIDKNDSTALFALYFDRSEAKRRARMFEEAYEDIMLAYQIDSANTVCLNNLGIILYELGRNEEGIECFHKAEELDPEYSQTFSNLAFYYGESGEYEKALKYSNIAVEKALPINAFPHNNRGYIKYKLGDFEGALEDINNSIKIMPENSYAYRNRALVYIALGEKEKACADLNKALKLKFTQTYGDEVELLLKEHCLSEEE